MTPSDDSGVRQDFEVGAFEIQALLRSAPQDQHASDVHDQADARDSEHPEAFDRWRVQEPLISLVLDVEGDAEQHDGVRDG